MALPPPHLKARKRFGQNILVDDFIIGAIVDAINSKEGVLYLIAKYSTNSFISLTISS